MRLFPYASSADKLSEMDTSSNISAIFERNLPSVDKEKKSIFIEKMLAYHNEFKRHRDNEMNYEGNAEPTRSPRVRVWNKLGFSTQSVGFSTV